MSFLRIVRVLVPIVGAICASTPDCAAAQAYNYPSLQLPTLSTRDYTAAIVGPSGTVALFQWRERVANNLHVSLDAGIADPQNNNLLIFAAGNLGRQLVRSSAEQPLDVLLTAGLGIGVGSSLTVLRIPIGASAGHRFALDDGLALTPYVHPRISLDRCTSCGKRNNTNSELSLNFDLGVNFDINENFAVRLAGLFSGSELLGKSGAFAIGIAWTPAAIKAH